MSVKDIFFGERNIQLLSKILGEELNIDNTKVARSACKNFVVTQMKLVFKKNENKIMNADPKKILPKLNDKAVSEALKVYSKSSNASGSKPEKSEKPGNMRRQHQQKPPAGPQAMQSGGGDSGYAPIISGDGDYITATGEMGMGGMDGDGDMNPSSMGYGYNPMASKRGKPAEINFCVDGGDTRGVAYDYIAHYIMKEQYIYFTEFLFR